MLFGLVTCFFSVLLSNNFLTTTRSSTFQQMQFFQKETIRALDHFVHQFRLGPTYECGVVQIIKDFAGGDDVGEALQSCLRTLEQSFGAVPTAADWTDTKVYHHFCGLINGRPVTVNVQNNGNYGLPAEAGDEIVISTTLAQNMRLTRLRVCTTTFGELNFASRRTAFIKCLLVHWRDEHCKYCDDLIIEEGCCSDCENRINTYKCVLCHSRCGMMLNERLKRGRGQTLAEATTNVFFHRACKRQRLE